MNVTSDTHVQVIFYYTVAVNAGEDETTGIHTSKTYTFSSTVLTMPIKKFSLQAI